VTHRNNTNDNERDILSFVDSNKVDVEAGWQQFISTHIQPDHLFRLATGQEKPSSKDEAHLLTCTRCRTVYQNYLPNTR
jgi:hypothetical protein